jgi:hypothetical protein
LVAPCRSEVKSGGDFDPKIASVDSIAGHDVGRFP